MMVRPGRRIASLALSAALTVAALPTRAARPLEEQVTITRDTFGVPHITGETDEAVAFGLGYAQAEDHPTLLARRVLEARGEAASVFGQEALENDLNARRADNGNEAKRHLSDLGADFRAVLRAFAAQGIYYGLGMMEIRFREFFFLLGHLPRVKGHIGILSTHLFYDPAADAHVILNFGDNKRMVDSFRTLIEIENTLQRMRPGS